MEIFGVKIDVDADMEEFEKEKDMMEQMDNDSLAKLKEIENNMPAWKRYLLLWAFSVNLYNDSIKNKKEGKLFTQTLYGLSLVTEERIVRLASEAGKLVEGLDLHVLASHHAITSFLESNESLAKKIDSLVQQEVGDFFDEYYKTLLEYLLDKAREMFMFETVTKKFVDSQKSKCESCDKKEECPIYGIGMEQNECPKSVH